MELIRKFIEAYVCAEDTNTGKKRMVYGDSVWFQLGEWERREQRRLDIDYMGLLRAIAMYTGCKIKRNRRGQEYLEGVGLFH